MMNRVDCISTHLTLLLLVQFSRMCHGNLFFILLLTLMALGLPIKQTLKIILNYTLIKIEY